MDPLESNQVEEDAEEPDSFQMTSAAGIVSFWPTSASVMRQMRENEQRQAQARDLATNSARIPVNRRSSTSSSFKESDNEDSANDVNPSSQESSDEDSSESNTQENAIRLSAFDLRTPSPKSTYGSETWSDWSRAARSSQGSENLQNSQNAVFSQHSAFSPVKQNSLAVIASIYADDQEDQDDSESFHVNGNSQEPRGTNSIIFMDSSSSQPFQDISNHGNQSSRQRGPLQSSQPRRDDLVTDMSLEVVTESTASRWDRNTPSSASASPSSEKHRNHVEQDQVIPAADDIGDHVGVETGNIECDIELVSDQSDVEIMEKQGKEEESAVAPVKKMPQRKPRNTKKSGLVFQCHRRFQRKLKKLSLLRVSGLASVYLAGVIEYLTAELLELAGNASRDMKLKRLIPRHILLAIRGDLEFDEFLRNVIIAGGGSYPFIHKFLRQKKKSKR